VRGRMSTDFAYSYYPVPNARSAEEKRKVNKRLYLTPDEANRLITAAGKRGRYPERDRILVRLVYRHGLRTSEACDLRCCPMVDGCSLEESHGVPDRQGTSLPIEELRFVEEEGIAAV
jgi:integrase